MLKYTGAYAYRLYNNYFIHRRWDTNNYGTIKIALLYKAFHGISKRVKSFSKSKHSTIIQWIPFAKILMNRTIPELHISFIILMIIKIRHTWIFNKHNFVSLVVYMTGGGEMLKYGRFYIIHVWARHFILFIYHTW